MMADGSLSLVGSLGRVEVNDPLHGNYSIINIQGDNTVELSYAKFSAQR